MTYDIFLMRVMHRTGLDERVVAQELIHHIVGCLGGAIRPQTAKEVAEHLPQPLAAQLSESGQERISELGTIYHSVADKFSGDISFGLEFTQVVFQVLGEAMGREMREELQSDLPEDWRVYFEPRSLAQPRYLHRRRDQRTLVGGQPGSSRPLSEARPGHRNSIAYRERR